MGESQKPPVRPILLAIVALGLTLCIAGCANSNGVYRDGTLAKGHSAIKGHVNGTQLSLAGATVKVEGKETKQVTTDANGNFIVYVRPGDYTVTVEKDGYLPQTANKTAESKVYLMVYANLVTADEARAAQEEQDADEILHSLEPSDVAWRCGQPGEEREVNGWPFYIYYPNNSSFHAFVSGDQAILSAEFAFTNQDGTLREYWVRTTASSHESTPAAAALAKVMPCLLKGGVAK